MMSNLPILIFLVPFVAALVCAATGWRWRRLARGVAAAAMLLTAGLSLYAAACVFAGAGTLRSHLAGWAPPLGIEWVLDPLGALVTALIGSVGAVAVLGTMTSVRAQMGQRETFFYACALLLVSGLMGMAATGDLFNLFVHLEVASLSAYALVAAGGRRAPRAALEYLVIGSIGASLYLLGVGFLYASTGSLNMADLATRLADADPRLTLTGIVLILVGLGVKMGLFPLHIWMPAAYSLAPLAASALMAPLATKVSAYAIIRVLFWVYQADYLRHHPLVLQALCWAGAAAIVIGAAKAISEDDLWRMLVYSSISQMGLVALGIGLANAASLTGAIMHIANDALMKGALFLAAGAILTRFNIRRIDDLPRLRGQAPWTAAVIVIVGLSLVGIPPLCGFYAKWYVLSGAIHAGAWFFAAVIVVGTLGTAAYVFRLLEQLFFASPPQEVEAAAAAMPRFRTMGMTGASVTLAAGVVLVGLLNERVVTTMIQPALPVLSGTL